MDLFPHQTRLFHIFSAEIWQAKNGELLFVVYFTPLSCTHTPCLSSLQHLLYENPTNCSFQSVLMTDAQFGIKVNLS